MFQFNITILIPKNSFEVSGQNCWIRFFFFVYRIVIVQRKNALTVKSLKTDFLYVEFWIMIRFRHGHNIIASSNNRPGNGSNVHANSCEEFQYPISGTESRFLPVIHFTLNPLFIQRSKSIGILRLHSLFSLHKREFFFNCW